MKLVFIISYYFSNTYNSILFESQPRFEKPQIINNIDFSNFVYYNHPGVPWWMSASEMIDLEIHKDSVSLDVANYEWAGRKFRSIKALDNNGDVVSASGNALFAITRTSINYENTDYERIRTSPIINEIFAEINIDIASQNIPITLFDGTNTVNLNCAINGKNLVLTNFTLLFNKNYTLTFPAGAFTSIDGKTSQSTVINFATRTSQQPDFQIILNSPNRSFFDTNINAQYGSTAKTEQIIFGGVVVEDMEWYLVRGYDMPQGINDVVFFGMTGEFVVNYSQNDANSQLITNLAINHTGVTLGRIFCVNLRTVDYRGSVIPNNCFANCVALERVWIGSPLTAFGTNTFQAVPTATNVDLELCSAEYALANLTTRNWRGYIWKSITLRN